MFEFLPDGIGDGLNLALIGAGAYHEVIGEGGDAGKVQHSQVSRLFGFGCADGHEPERNIGMVLFCSAQTYSLSVSYYKRDRMTARAYRSKPDRTGPIDVHPSGALAAGQPTWRMQRTTRSNKTGSCRVP